MLMDISSEMIHALLPVFMTTTLGMSVLAVGIIEGLAESVALTVKMFSGALSDWLGKRKALAVVGYGLAALTKPAFALAQSAGVVMAARLADRIGKGIRGAPRDAMVADITPPAIRGAAFGLRQALDTLGAVLGPLAAVGLMLLWQDDFRAVFKVAAIPAFCAVALLVVGVREPKAGKAEKRTNPIRFEKLKTLSASYWRVVAIGSIFTLARFSEAFLVLRAAGSGVGVAYIPLVMAIMSFIYSLSAYPFGVLADRMPAERLLAFGVILLIAADLVLAFGTHWLTILAGVALWGVHMGATQGLLAKMVADSAPSDLIGTAYGFFNLASGVSMLFASAIAGLLWEQFGARGTFCAGAVFCCFALVCLFRRPSRA